MKITTVKSSNSVTISLDGWLDTVSAPELKEEIDKIESADNIVLDFEKTEYIASSGLRQVVSCYRKAKELNAEFSVINVTPTVMGIFTLTGLDKKISISPIN